MSNTVILTCAVTGGHIMFARTLIGHESADGFWYFIIGFLLVSMERHWLVNRTNIFEPLIP